jgi:hypothetical protein
MLLFNSSLSKILSIELTALETDSKGKVISSPRVVTFQKTIIWSRKTPQIPALFFTPLEHPVRGLIGAQDPGD